MKNRGVIALLVVAVLLLGVAALLARCGDQKLSGGVTLPSVKRVEFPRERALRETRMAEVAKRQGQPPPKTTTVTSTDRLSRALSSPLTDGAVVFEVNALRHSPLVDAILKCRRAQRGDEMQGLDFFKEELGIDVTEDIDRVALDKEVLAVSGFFDGLKLPAELGEGAAYGDGGRVYRLQGDDGKPAFVAKVGTDLIMTSTDEGELHAAIDRAEGRAEAKTSFPEGVVGGEMYGVVGPGLLKDLLGLTGQDTMAPLLAMLTTSQVRMAVDDTAALSLDLGTTSPKDGEELAKALGGAVSVARAEAMSAGREDLAGMLEQARAVPRPDGSVAFDIAVPGDDLLKAMGCPPIERAPEKAP